MTSKFEGAEAKPRGVTATASLAVPAPTLVTARIRNSYSVPFASRVPSSSCVTKADVDNEYVFAIASTQPAGVFTWRLYPRMREPPSDSGGVHSIIVNESPGRADGVVPVPRR